MNPGARRHGRLAPFLGCLAGVVVVAVGSAAGVWCAPFVVAAVLGVGSKRLALPAAGTIAAAVGAGAVGWAVPLLRRWLDGQPTAATAETIGALAGLPAAAGPVVAATVLVAVLQAAVGCWLGRSFTPGPRADAASASSVGRG